MSDAHLNGGGRGSSEGMDGATPFYANAAHPATLAPDLAEAAHFLVLLDEEAEEWCFQTFDDNKNRGDKTLVRVRNGTLDQHATELARLNARGAGIFVTVQVTDGQGRKLENIIAVRAVFQECDRPGTPEPPLEPNLVIESSPGKFHRYFLVEHSTDFTLFDAVQARLVQDFGSDPNAKDRARVLRLPGFFHLKDPANPWLVRIVHESGAQPYSSEALTAAIPPLERTSPTTEPLPPGKGLEDESKARSALATLDPDMQYDDWLKIGAALHHASTGSVAGFELWDHWSAGGAMYRRGETQYRWATFGRYNDRPATIATLFKMAADATLEAARDTVAKAIETAKVEGDPGAVFEPETIEALRRILETSRADYIRWRAKVKRAHKDVLITEIDRTVKGTGDGGDDSGRGPKQADLLIELAEEAELFHGPDATAFADLMVNDHRETWPVRTKGFRRWLARRFFEASGGAPNSEALQSALNVIEAKAHFDGPEREVHIRIGGLGDKLYLDLGDECWRAVEIDSDGWRVVEEPPVRFRRAAGMQALPMPQTGGSIEALRRFLNVQGDNDFVLVVTWALSVMRNCGPYPVLVLSGEQGSAKSTFSAILRSLLDPNTAPLRALPREDRDLFIAANNGHVLAFDNVSGLPAWISDTLCRLATGGGFAVRQLYTDQDEVLFDAARPVILNGIEDIVMRPDLADRAIFLTLEPIPEDRRRPEKDLWTEFNAARPQLLGTLLDAVFHGLKRLPDTRLDSLPRMADFALWATACETALWTAGTFGAAYTGNRDEAVDSVIEADPVGSAIRSLIGTRTEWTGTASDLLGALDEEVGEKVRKSKAWPSSARALSGRVRRAATFLRKVGIDITFEREGRARTRTIRITCKPESAPARPSASSLSSAPPPNCSGNNGFDIDDPRTVSRRADANAGRAEPETVRHNCDENNEIAAADGADASSQAHSSGWRTRL